VSFYNNLARHNVFSSYRRFKLMARSENLSSHQIKAARALLDWSQEKLAAAARLSIATIRKLEVGNISPRGKTNQYVCEAFEDAGFEFIEPNGVRQRPDDIVVFEGEKGIQRFFDDVYETSRRTGEDVIQVWPSAEEFLRIIGDYRKFHADRMMALGEHLKVKSIVTESTECIPSIYCEYRYLSRLFIDFVPFYVYGDKYAIVPSLVGASMKAIVIHSRAASEAFRRQFEAMWEKATPIPRPKHDRGD